MKHVPFPNDVVSGPRPWSIVLAGGEGKRLLPLTAALLGRPIAKQFVALDGRRSLLQRTVERALEVSTPHRTLVVANAPDEALCRAQLADYPGVVLVLQPRNAGTAPGLMLPLAHVRREEADAPVLVWPSDHHFERPRVMLDVMRAVAGGGDDGRFVLMATPATRPARDLGWILPGCTLQRRGWLAVRAVRTFVEKPSEARARWLFAAGGLWSTFMLAGRASTLWSAVEETAPEVASRFAPLLSCRHDGMERAYRWMPAVDLSRAVLARSPRLATAVLPECGWTDLGTPERALAAFQGLGRRLPARPWVAQGSAA